MSKFVIALCLTLTMPGLLGLAEPAHAQARTITRSQAAAVERDPDRALQAVYATNPEQRLWFNAQSEPTPQALSLLRVLREADAYGLRARDYDGIGLTYRLTNAATAAPPADLAQLDRDISRSALRFIRDLHYGRIDPRQAGFDLPQGHKDLSLSDALQTLSQGQDIEAAVARMEPQFLHFQLLKQALARYRLLAVDEELTQLPAFQERAIKPGEAYVGAPALRKLLVAEQDLPAAQALPDSDSTLDPALVAALKAYQTRHGLTADGALGRKTFAALITPFSQRIQQIELTLERWRWLPPAQSPLIVVNIPQFKLFAFNSTDDREANLLRMDVIVGQAFEHTRTPVFMGEMKYVVFRPYWDVPRDITQRELLPSIQRDPRYLQRNDMELVNGQGDNSPVVPATPENLALLANGKLRIRQRPGEQNALGEVKFMLPNAYNVYLHSTPAKQLFARSSRAFSHGCIRVSDPVALAQYVLGHADGEWDKLRIEQMMTGNANQRINLRSVIPVLIVYGTAMPLESGAVQFFEDIYGQDQKLAKLLSATR